MGNRAGSTPAPGTKTASKEAVFLVLYFSVLNTNLGSGAKVGIRSKSWGLGKKIR